MNDIYVINIVCVTVCTDIMHQNFPSYGPDPAKTCGVCLTSPTTSCHMRW